MLTRTILSGMTQDQLKEALQKAQDAYMELAMGKRGVAFSYTQGDGTRSVTYNKASLQDLMALIQLLQGELGLPTGRRAARFRF